MARPRGPLCPTFGPQNQDENVFPLGAPGRIRTRGTWFRESDLVLSAVAARAANFDSDLRQCLSQRRNVLRLFADRCVQNVY